MIYYSSPQVSQLPTYMYFLVPAFRSSIQVLLTYRSPLLTTM